MAAPTWRCIDAPRCVGETQVRRLAETIMRLTCPFCGTRGIEEFSYAGDATLTRPAPDADPAAWVDYAYMRKNPAGLHSELWYHAAACRQFLQVERDTRTHDILSTRLA